MLQPLQRQAGVAVFSPCFLPSQSLTTAVEGARAQPSEEVSQHEHERDRRFGCKPESATVGCPRPTTTGGLTSFHEHGTRHHQSPVRKAGLSGAIQFEAWWATHNSASLGPQLQRCNR